MDKVIYWDVGLEPIKYCPRCGGEPCLVDNGKFAPVIDSNGAYVDIDIKEPTKFFVECKSCGLMSKVTKTEEETIALWNKKVEDWGKGK